MAGYSYKDGSGPQHTFHGSVNKVTPARLQTLSPDPTDPICVQVPESH